MADHDDRSTIQLSEQAIRWRCRRGTRELDQQLQRFVEQRYACLNEQDKAAFSRLLDMEDPLLADYLSGALTEGNTEIDANIYHIIQQIRQANLDD